MGGLYDFAFMAAGLKLEDDHDTPMTYAWMKWVRVDEEELWIWFQEFWAHYLATNDVMFRSPIVEGDAGPITLRVPPDPGSRRDVGHRY